MMLVYSTSQFFQVDVGDPIDTSHLHSETSCHRGDPCLGIRYRLAEIPAVPVLDMLFEPRPMPQV
jgi:hypothetical protein